MLGMSTMVLGRSTMVLGRSTMVLGRSTMVLEKSTMALGRLTKFAVFLVINSGKCMELECLGYFNELKYT